MLQEEQVNEKLDGTCSCSTGYFEQQPCCDLCFLSEVKEDFYCPEHQIDSEYGYDEDDDSSENYPHEKRSHDHHSCACGIFRDFVENVPVEISTSKDKNIPLYFKSIDLDECRVSFFDPASERIISTDCRNITSIRYNKYE
ncbi:MULTISPECIES: hypothetical protein [Bacillaceae]|uniref:Spore coat protein n=2 Tax=Bacillaceae TaxID=186817 RepID=A0ABR8VRD3_9BACI|nr:MULTISPECIES: hypothetical protein [Bacillaceae]MBD8007337.1 hypothetical protein [Bacillus norwichensis]GIN19869.1 hypothetical protein J1TS3_10030 [Siminovitchia fordii]